MRWIFILPLILITFFSRGQSPYNFFQLSLDKGLSDSRVTDIVQDHYGFMWFGTPNGLNRYDGYSIKTFHSSQGNNGLPSNSIVSLYASRKGELWIGTATGVVKFDFAKQKFLHFDTSYKEGAEIDKASISDFEEDRDGNIYVATVGGVFRYLNIEKKWESVNNILSQPGRLRRIRRLKFFTDDLLYASTSGNIPLFEINIKTKSIDSILINVNDTCCPNTYGIEKINNNLLMVGLLSHGIVNVNTKTKENFKIPGVLSENDSIRYNTVYDILKDSRGRIWMASFYFRLAEYLPTENRTVTFEKDPYNPYSFDGNSALCVYEDRQHNLWVGTSGKGVYRFNPDDNVVKFTAGNDYNPGSIPRGQVLSLVVTDSNSLFVGTDKGPSFFNFTTKKYKNFKGLSTTGIDAPLEYAQIGLADQNGKYIWIGTNRLGLMRYDKIKETFQCFSRVTKPYPLHDDGISDLLQLPDGNLFTIGFGLPGIFNTKTFEYTSKRNNTNKVFNVTGVSSICYDEKKNIWLATGNGKLYEYDIQEKQLWERSNYLKGVKGLEAIYKIIADHDELFLGTNVGLVILKKGVLAEVHSLRHPDNLMDEVRSMVLDGEYIWLSNIRVLGRLHRKTGKLIFIGQRDGLSNVQFIPSAFTLTPQGTIIIGSHKGYYEINGERIRRNNMSTPPYLTSFLVSDKPLEMEAAISGASKIRLKNSQNFFSFEISSFDYQEAGDIEYAYKLEGFDKDWQYLGKNRTGSYTNVSGGDYTLKLQSRHMGGEWNGKGQSISIHINKHYSESWWFWISLFLLAAGLSYVYYRSRIIRINKNAQIRSDYEIKLNELENSALRTQMNPHFIFNSLNTINSFISRNETTQAHQYISKFSKLIRYILDHSRQRKILLSDELDVLNLYIQIESIRFENKFDFKITVDDQIDPSTVELPPLIIQPFVENAILHGLLPLARKGLLKIDLVHKDDLLLCTVTDDGIGREKSRMIKKDYLTKHTSHGIEITLKRIELFNKEHGKDETVVITDLTSGGTKVEIPVAWEESF